MRPRTVLVAIRLQMPFNLISLIQQLNVHLFNVHKRFSGFDVIYSNGWYFFLHANQFWFASLFVMFLYILHSTILTITFTMSSHYGKTVCGGFNSICCIFCVFVPLTSQSFCLFSTGAPNRFVNSPPSEWLWAWVRCMAVNICRMLSTFILLVNIFKMKFNQFHAVSLSLLFIFCLCSVQFDNAIVRRIDYCALHLFCFPISSRYFWVHWTFYRSLFYNCYFSNVEFNWFVKSSIGINFTHG